jgi:hypothetical protein
MFRHDKLLAVMESRFDYASARAVLAEALAKAGLSATRKEFDADELRAIAAGVAGSPKADAVVSKLIELADAMGGPKGKAKEPPPVEEPHAVEEPAEEPADETSADRHKGGKKGKR